MPTYTFRNVTTGDITEHTMRMSELDQFKVANPDLEQYHSTETMPGLGDPMRMDLPGVTKANDAFEKGVIERIKRNVPGNTLVQGHKHKASREW